MGPMCAPYPCSSDREPATTQHRKLPDGIRRRPLLSVNEPYLTTHSRDISLQLSCSDTRFWSGTETMTNARESFMPVLGPDSCHAPQQALVVADTRCNTSPHNQVRGSHARGCSERDRTQTQDRQHLVPHKAD